MPWTTNLLVIANRTVDSEELLQTLRARALAGPIRVTLVAPDDARRLPTARRLESAIERLQAEDIPVEGIVGHPDPLVAVEEIWDPRRFDEVIVATLPTDVSRWMALDLPRRIARFTGARVSHVVAPARPGSRTLRAHA
jgi:GABA permease